MTNGQTHCKNFALFTPQIKFPEIWKKANVVPAHEKEDKMLVKNYRTISLLPIFGKMFERVI